MNVFSLLMLLTAAVFLIGMDVSGRTKMFKVWPLFLFLPLAQNPVVLYYIYYKDGPEIFSSGMRVAHLIIVSVVLFYFWARLNLFPVRDGHTTGIRLKVMIGGRTLVYCGFLGSALQIVLFASFYPYLYRRGMPGPVLAAGIIYAMCILFVLFANGILRMFFTSKRLSVMRRVVMVLTLWIPVVNFIVFALSCRLVYEEYDYACYKKKLRDIRAESNLCQTRYPILMVHGILFRDLRFFNYWGRIPGELIRNGALIYYGNQEAVGTTQYNGEDIRRRIIEIMKDTGCEKVNIIAHSKGGLDARYAIGKLGMAPFVASLTTINTPHRGCLFVDKACRLPDRLYRFAARIFDGAFRKFGDKNPDFYTATRAFSTEASRKFNEEVPDAAGVYYQSYMSKMKNRFSDSLLTITYSLIKPLEGENDGLVAVPSAQWGDYRGLFTSSGRRGISHGDMIDLKREDYKGFDVTETYVKIVSELKEKGF
ncbi:triacylglycerol lipase [Anaerolentibacter hominis]|uniref:esterase/lipase family protein n=1 Tax=Anaerolentibacter hominis TaxID=3079009 RepID=UPI0031B867C2